MSNANRYFVGLDLGQARDYTAFAVLERLGPKPHAYHLRHLERPELGTPYPKIVARAKQLMAAPELAGRAHLVADATGVGRPVMDLLRQAGLEPVPVTITGGDAPGFDNGGWRVPKRDLVSTLQVLFQSERLRIAEGLPEAPVLVRELLEFRAKINIATGHDSYEAWREGAHDDLVLAAALAAWYGERWSPPHRPQSYSFYSW